MNTSFGVTLIAPNTSIGEKVWTLWQLKSTRSTTRSSLKPMEWKLFYTSLQPKRMKLRIGSEPMATRPSTIYAHLRSTLFLGVAYFTRFNITWKSWGKRQKKKSDRWRVSRQASLFSVANRKKKRKRRTSGRSYRHACKRQTWAVVFIRPLQTFSSIRGRSQWLWSDWGTVKLKIWVFKILRWDVWALPPS